MATIVRKPAISFGLEDLSYGIHRPMRSASKSNLNGTMLRLMGGPIADKYCTDVTSFAMEAVNLLGDSEKFGLYATQGLEEINYELAILSKVKKDFGVENLNIRKFSMEALDIKGALKKVWAAIVEAFKRIIRAAANFFRSVANFFGSAVAKFQSKLYFQYKGSVDRLTNSKTEIKALIPAFSGTGANNFVKSVVAGITSSLPAVNKHVAATNNPAADQFEKEARNKILAWKTKSGDAGKGFSNPHKDIVDLFWKTKKPDPIAAGAFIKAAGGIEILSEASLAAAKQIIASGQQTVKTATAAMRKAEKEAVSSAKADTKMNSAYGKDAGVKPKEINKFNKDYVAVTRESAKRSSWERQYCGYATGLLLNTFSQWLKLRSYVATAVKAAAKGDKVEAAKKKKKEE